MKKSLIRVGIGLSVVIAIALVVCFVPLKEVAYTVTVDYQDIETYYQDEPYEEMEAYYEDEPYEEIETYYETEPLTYEVVKSYTDIDSYEERRQIVIGGVVFQDEVVEVFFPIGCVALQNTNSVYGTFGIQFTFYAMGKLDAAMLGQLPGFKFEDYLAAADPQSYLDRLDWDKLDWESIKIFREEYNEQKNLALEPSETGTVTYSIQDIDIDKDVWEWKYTITEATKTVEKQRTVMKYRQVEKERTVTKYRQVQKQRTIIKQRPETHYKRVTLLDYLLLY